jgi:glycosyltransferase involved in cell wall biosynthesis
MAQMQDRPWRILAVATHPVQYMSQIFRRLAAQPEMVDLNVVYLSLRGAEAGYDPGFNTTVKWDIPLLNDYQWVCLPRAESPLSWSPALWKLIRNGNFDAVLCFTGYRRITFWTALTAAKRSRAAFLFGTDSTNLKPRDGSSWKAAAKEIFWPYLFKLADQVIVPSSGARDLMFSLGISADRVTITPYTVDNDWWFQQSKLVDRVKVRSKWGIPLDSMIVLFSAKLQDWKRPLDLLYAFHRANLPNSMLLYVGEGPMRSEIVSRASSLGVSDQVKLLGFVNQTELPAIYTSADLMVLPSAYEPFGVVVNEAMCCGCPVASSDQVGAARDLIVPVCPDFVYRCGDVERLTAILSGTDRSKLEGLRQKFRSHISTWSPDRNITACMDAVSAAVSHAVGKASNPPSSTSPV